MTIMCNNEFFSIICMVAITIASYCDCDNCFKSASCCVLLIISTLQQRIDQQKNIGKKSKRSHSTIFEIQFI